MRRRATSAAERPSTPRAAVLRGGLATSVARRSGGTPAARWGAARRIAVALGLALASACSRSPAGGGASSTPAATATPGATPAPSDASSAMAAPTAIPPSATLAAPARAGARDLDLQRAWRAAGLTQAVSGPEQPWRFRPFFDFVVLGGAGHRSLLLLPSRDGAPSAATYRVTLPADAPAALEAWLAIAPATLTSSDGVEYGVSVAAPGATPAPVRFERLTPEAAARGWTPLRVDLSPWAGRTVEVSLLSREPGERSGDWLLWGDPRIVASGAPTAPVIDLGAPDARRRREARIPWSEANLYKTYSVFRDGDELDPGWITRPFPWLRSFRLFSSLGANWGPTLEAKYDTEMGRNPVQNTRWETEHAKRYEFFRDGGDWRARPFEARFEWPDFDRMNDRAAASGLEVHFNLAGAPEVFTGDKGEYQTYHFNEMPIVDGAGWQRYVDTLFGHLRAKPWFARTHYSFFNEPNCLWTEADGTVRHFGYEGDAEQYARQYLWTWQAMKPYVAPGQLHLGPFVAEPDHADGTADNLPAFLGAIAREFDAHGEPLPPWSAFAFNVYETPQIGLDDIASTKVAYARSLLAEQFPGRSIPLRFDEFGIHPILFPAFQKDAGRPLYSTRWAMTWQAEMLALLLDENVQQAGSWLHIYLLQDEHDSSPYLAELFLTRVVHGTDMVLTDDGWLAATPVAEPAGKRPRDVQVRRANEGADRVGYAWSSGADGSVRLAVWRHPRFLLSDAQLASDGAPEEVVVRLPHAGEGAAWEVRLIAPKDQALPPLDRAHDREASIQAFPNLPSLAVRDGGARDELRLSLRPGDLVYLEAKPGAQPG